MPYPHPVIAQASPGAVWPILNPSPSFGTGGIALPNSGTQAPVRVRAMTLPSTTPQTLSQLCPNLALPGSASEPLGAQPVVTPCDASPSKPLPTVLPLSPSIQRARSFTAERPADTLLIKPTPTHELRRTSTVPILPRAEAETRPANESPPKENDEKCPQPSAPRPPVQSKPTRAAANAGAAKSRKRPRNDVGADTKATKKTRKNPPVPEHYLNTFKCEPPANQVVNHAGPSSTASQAISPPPPPQPAYPPQQPLPLIYQQENQMPFAAPAHPTPNYAPQLSYQPNGHQQLQQPHLPLGPGGMQATMPYHTPSRRVLPSVLLQVPSYGIPTFVTPRPPTASPFGRGIIQLTGLVAGPMNTPIEPNPHARYVVQMLRGPRLAEARRLEGLYFYGNEMYDPSTLEQWVLRVVQRFPDRGAPHPSQVPLPAQTVPYLAAEAATYAPVEDMQATGSLDHMDVTAMAQSTVSFPHQYYTPAAPALPQMNYEYSSSATSYAPVEENPATATAPFPQMDVGPMTASMVPHPNSPQFESDVSFPTQWPAPVSTDEALMNLVYELGPTPGVTSNEGQAEVQDEIAFDEYFDFGPDSVAEA